MKFPSQAKLNEIASTFLFFVNTPKLREKKIKIGKNHKKQLTKKDNIFYMATND